MNWIKKQGIRHNFFISQQILITFKVFTINHNILVQMILPLFETVFKIIYRWDVLYAFQRFVKSYITEWVVWVGAFS